MRWQCDVVTNDEIKSISMKGQWEQVKCFEE